MGLFAYKPKAYKKKKHTKFRQYSYDFGGRRLLLQGYEGQALEYLTNELGFVPEDIKCECELNGVFTVRYKYGGKFRDYFPDIYIPKAKLIVEVKSDHTLGLKHNKKRGWSMTCAKAMACHDKGYRFMLLLLDRKGNRIYLPKNWPKMKKDECLTAMKELNEDNTDEGLMHT